MVEFTCNLCGAHNRVESFATEPATCPCGSNVRVRALIHLLSSELFGRSLPLFEFPTLKAIRGIGMSDKECYARILAEKFDYTNTFYDREPRLDFSQSHPQLAGQYHFILSADVIEHIAPPLENALEEACRLLKPDGFLGVTVFCNPEDRLREHFPDLHQPRIVRLGDSPVLINRRQDGRIEVHENLVFHGGSGATLEMREFGITSLERHLLAAGFRQVHFLRDDLPEIGVFFDHDVSQPLIARKEPFTPDRQLWTNLIDQWRDTQDHLHREHARAENATAQSQTLSAQIAAASNSRWLRLGRKLNLGPRFP